MDIGITLIFGILSCLLCFFLPSIWQDEKRYFVCIAVSIIYLLISINCGIGGSAAVGIVMFILCQFFMGQAWSIEWEKQRQLRYKELQEEECKQRKLEIECEKQRECDLLAKAIAKHSITKSTIERQTIVAKCKYCGNYSHIEGKFCNACGASIWS